MINSYNFDEQPPTTKIEIECREALLAVTRDITDEFGLEIETFTAWQEDKPERVQGIFLQTSTASGPWCIGAVVRRHNGELRIWPRNDDTGPVQGSKVIQINELESSIFEMVEQFTAA